MHSYSGGLGVVEAQKVKGSVFWHIGLVCLVSVYLQKQNLCYSLNSFFQQVVDIVANKCVHFESVHFDQ